MMGLGMDSGGWAVDSPAADTAAGAEPGRDDSAGRVRISILEQHVNERRKMATELVQMAREQGAREAEVLLTRVVSRTASEGDRALEETTTTDAHIRVYDSKGSMSMARGRVAESTGADTILRRAVRALGKALPEGHELPPRLDIPTRGLSILDRRQSRLIEEDRLDVLRLNRDQCREAPASVRVGPLSYSEEFRERVFVSSGGVDVVEESSSYCLSGVAWRAESPDQRVRAEVRSRTFADVASRPLGHELCARTGRLGTRASMPGSRTAVVVEPRAVAAILEAIVPSFRAERVDTKRSFLAGRVGTRIGSEKLHVVDDGRLGGALETRSFDDRGVSPVAMTLIREGIADAMYEGPQRAARHGRRPTGHERADGTLWPGNLIIRPGSRSRNMLFPALGSFVAIDAVLDTSGISERSGAIKVPVRLSRWEGPTWQGTIGEAVLDTTVFELFGGIRNLTSDQGRYGRVDACTWITEGPWFAD